MNGGTLKNASGNTFNPTSTGKAVVIGAAGGTLELNGLQMQLDDANQLSGAGNLTLTNSSATAGTMLLGGTSVGYASFTGNIFVNPATTGGVTLKLVNANAAGVSGNTVVMANNLSALDFQAAINNNVVVGGTGIAGAGAMISSATGGGTASSASVTLTADTLINNANAITLGGLVTDNERGFKVTKTGVGALVLNGSNTFTGGIVIGTTASQKLSLGNSAALGAGTLTVQSAAAGTSIDSALSILSPPTRWYCRATPVSARPPGISIP